jgi:hypothetical protein
MDFHADLVGMVRTASGCFSLPPLLATSQQCSPVLDFSNQASNFYLSVGFFWVSSKILSQNKH